MQIIFTMHAKCRLLQRKILADEVTDIIHWPDLVVKKYGQYYYQKKVDRGTIEVVCEKTESNIKIITVYWV